jgi:hypothetical protein
LEVGRKQEVGQREGCQAENLGLRQPHPHPVHSAKNTKPFLAAASTLPKFPFLLPPLPLSHPWPKKSQKNDQLEQRPGKQPPIPVKDSSQHFPIKAKGRLRSPSIRRKDTLFSKHPQGGLGAEQELRGSGDPEI